MTRVLLLWIVIAVTFPNEVSGQNRIDSLRRIIDQPGTPDSIRVRTAIGLCKELVNTDQEFLLPEYAIKGINADTSGNNMLSGSILHEFLGNHYWQVGKLNEAASQFNQLRLIGETLADTNKIAVSYNGLGTVYYLMNDYDQALDYYRKGLAMSGNDSLIKSRLFTNIANTLMEKGQMDSVLHYYSKSALYHLRHKQYRYLSIVHGNMALASRKLHDAGEIRKHLNMALEAAVNTKDPYQIASIYLFMGEFAAGQHPKMAFDNYSQALKLARSIHSFDQIQECLRNLSILAEEAGHYQEAISYLTELTKLSDSINLAQKKSRIQEMEAEHQAALRNAREMKKAQEQEVRSLREENRRKIMLILLSVAFITTVFLLLMGIRMYRLRMKISKTKERFFSMIAHDIRNPFSGILGLSGLLNEESENMQDPVHRKQIRSLHQSLNHVYHLLENLLQWSQSETGKIAFNPVSHLISPFVDEVVCLHTESAKQKGVQLENRIPAGLTARFDVNMVQTIMRNLISNAIKFSPENSRITLIAETKGAEVVISVSDQGIGMSPEQIDRIFKSEQGTSTPGTKNESGTGLGLILCKSFIVRHGGRLWVESKPGEGTTFRFTLPN